ncbi:MAG: HNH endonuclease [Bacillota bacterium]
MGTIPSNHRLAERKLISLVRSGEWEIDKLGRIWRTCVRRGLKNGGSHLVPVKRRRVEKVLPSGYLLIRAVIDGKRITGFAHRLVWQHYFGDIPEGMIINHKNGLKDDCRPDNIVPSTHSENLSHACQGGLKDQFGQKNPAAKLTDREVAQIRLAYAGGGYTMEALAEKFSVSYQTISKIVRGQRRKKQGGPVQDWDQRHCACERDPNTGCFIGKKHSNEF